MKKLKYLLLLFLLIPLNVKADNEQFWSKTNLARFADGQWTQIGSKTSTSDTIQLTGIYEYDYYPYSISVYGSKLTPFATDMIYNLSFRVTYPSTNLFNWKKAMQVASPNLTITNVNVKYCTLNTNTDYYSEWTCQFTVGENAGSYYDIGVDWYNYILSNQGLGYLLDSYNQTLTISLVLTSNKDYNGQIVSQNEVIIGQNSQILDQQRKNLEEQQKTNEKLDSLNDSINNQTKQQEKTNDTLNDDDTTDSTNKANEFFSGFTTDTFGLTSIITAPLSLIGSITSSTCSPLSLDIPFLSKNNKLNLPCMNSIYRENFGSFLDIYQTITFGIVAYWVCVKIFALVKEFKNPDEDKVEVLDL